MKKLLPILLCLPILVLSQTRNCGTMEHLEYLKGQDPQLEQKMVQDEIDLQNRLQNQSNSKASSVITIPVVVHVVYNNSTENISDAQIHSQILVLNQDFRRLNADAFLVPSVFQSLASDIEVEFCLAAQDPNGMSTTGITRTFTNQTSWGWDEMKYSSLGGIDAWDTDSYLNIWVVNPGTSGTLGYAQFPASGLEETDGVVMGYPFFGNIGTVIYPYDQGRTLTHEVGHWLNLYHIWGDSFCGDDYCNDTPTQEQDNGGCPSFPNVTCSNGPNGDMFMNYMDYTNDACMYMFTEDQKTRMIDAINTHRSGLLISNGCSSSLIGGCTDASAYNYNSNATIDDGSCCYIAGCMDPAATNYNSSACFDDGSCNYPGTDTIYGCTDITACNYDSNANLDDGSCIFPDGCTDVTACNYDASATCDDGSCLTDYGCTDATACNYDASATCDDASCYYNILGSIIQDGENLYAATTPVGLNADWYNIQTEDTTTRIWLMEEGTSSFTPTFECSYFIVVSDNGCVDTSETYYYGANAARIGSIITSPNPTSGLINVKFDNSKNQFVMFELISNNGTKLDEFITIENNLDIDLSKYPSGSYYLYFNSEDAVQGCRLEEVQKVSTKIILNK